MSFMSTNDNQKFNPWSTRKNHLYEDILKYVSQVEHHKLLPQNEVILRYNETPIAHGLKVIHEATQTLDQLHEIELKCLELELENKAADILRTEETSVKLKKISDTLHGFETCVSNAEQIQQTLQQSFQENYMKIEISCHKDAMVLFKNTAKTLSELQSILASLDWHKNNSFDNTSVVQVVNFLSKSTQELRKSLQTLKTVSESLSLK